MTTPGTGCELHAQISEKDSDTRQWAMCDSIRLELRHLGVGVGTVHPTFFNTPMMDRVLQDPAGRMLWGEHKSQLWKMIPIETVVRAIETRAPMTVIPKANNGVARAPGLFRPLIERAGWRKNQIPQTIELVRRQRQRQRCDLLERERPGNADIARLTHRISRYVATVLDDDRQRYAWTGRGITCGRRRADGAMERLFHVARLEDGNRHGVIAPMAFRRWVRPVEVRFITSQSSTESGPCGADEHYREITDLLLLRLAPDRSEAPVVIEAVGDGNERLAHLQVQAEIRLEAVERVGPITLGLMEPSNRSCDEFVLSRPAEKWTACAG